jgi:K+-sensing histidine kinase KdpD
MSMPRYSWPPNFPQNEQHSAPRTMKGILTFVVAVAWGSLSAQFLVQVITSVVVALVYITGIAFSKVARGNNLMGALTGLLQAIIFAALFVGGNWITSEYLVSYDTWNAASIAALVSFLATIIYTALQVPGKIRLAHACAWVPSFVEASMQVPAHERIAFARKASGSRRRSAR